ncbi:hypothetical protein BDC45DRAFT_509619 [Circinella umbellata]|nr:hypothetical protein BDC45DRAFT_521538 [Circinella umbellata]KAI7854022.1 hypothetical protein BDC45DRAFT_509619 [Circinella umbellata]
MTQNDRNNTHSVGEMATALLRLKDKMEEENKKTRWEIKKLKTALSEQTDVNKRLLTLLEKQDYKNHNPDDSVVTMLPDIKPFRRTVVNKKTGRSREVLKGFAWDLYHDLIKVYRKKNNMKPLSPEEIDTRVSNLKRKVQKVVDEFKLKYKINKDATWKTVKPYYYTMYIDLEEEVGALVPLKACENHWGSHMALAKKWQNVQQASSNSRKTDNGCYHEFEEQNEYTNNDNDDNNNDNNDGDNDDNDGGNDDNDGGNDDINNDDDNDINNDDYNDSDNDDGYEEEEIQNKIDGQQEQRQEENEEVSTSDSTPEPEYDTSNASGNEGNYEIETNDENTDLDDEYPESSDNNSNNTKKNKGRQTIRKRKGMVHDANTRYKKTNKTTGNKNSKKQK